MDLREIMCEDVAWIHWLGIWSRYRSYEMVTKLMVLRGARNWVELLSPPL
jgi:hypothetical protein